MTPAAARAHLVRLLDQHEEEERKKAMETGKQKITVTKRTKGIKLAMQSIISRDPEFGGGPRLTARPLRDDVESVRAITNAELASELDCGLAGRADDRHGSMHQEALKESTISKAKIEELRRAATNELRRAQARELKLRKYQEKQDTRDYYEGCSTRDWRRFRKAHARLPAARRRCLRCRVHAERRAGVALHGRKPGAAGSILRLRTGARNAADSDVCRQGAGRTRQGKIRTGDGLRSQAARAAHAARRRQDRGRGALPPMRRARQRALPRGIRRGGQAARREKHRGAGAAPVQEGHHDANPQRGFPRGAPPFTPLRKPTRRRGGPQGAPPGRGQGHPSQPHAARAEALLLRQPALLRARRPLAELGQGLLADEAARLLQRARRGRQGGLPSGHGAAERPLRHAALLLLLPAEERPARPALALRPQHDLRPGRFAHGPVCPALLALGRRARAQGAGYGPLHGGQLQGLWVFARSPRPERVCRPLRRAVCRLCGRRPAPSDHGHQDADVSGRVGRQGGARRRRRAAHDLIRVRPGGAPHHRTGHAQL